MSKEKILVGKPTSALLELNAVLAFEQEHPLVETSISKNYGTKTENLYLLKDFDVVDSCYIEANSDIRSCILSFPKLKKEGPRKMVMLATEYALEIMDMAESFVFAEKEDKSMIHTLNNLGYEYLGEEEKMETFVKDKPIIKESEATKWK